MSSERGKVTFEVPAGTYTIVAFKDNLRGEERGTTISSDYQTTITIRPNPTLQVRVQDVRNRAIEGASVKVIRVRDNKEVATGRTERDGTIRFQLEPDSYTVEASKPEYKEKAQTSVTLSSGDDIRTVTLTLRGYTVTITVRDQQGNLVSGATVRILDQSGNIVEEKVTP